MFGIFFEKSLLNFKKGHRCTTLPFISGKLCGLAGNYNGNSADDFISSQNIKESTPASFGNSWKLNDDCKDVENIAVDPCQINSEKGSETIFLSDFI